MFGSGPRHDQEKEIQELQKSILETREKINKLRAEQPEEEIQDYEMTSLDGNPIKLSELFGDKDEMMLIHNMGPGCPYCTLWADGFKGFMPYFESRCAFVTETDKDANSLNEFAKGRDWNFVTVSSINTTLKNDLGFKAEDNSNWPGMSTLYKKDGKIFRHSKETFGPGDDYCSVWHMMTLLKKGVNDWQPKFNL